jgi:hypothetical protein
VATSLSPSTPQSIIYLLPRRQLRQRASAIVALAASPGCPQAQLRRQIAEAAARFGDDLVAELRRRLAQADDATAAPIILLLRAIATDPAHQALWWLAENHSRPAAARLDALRALCQLGEPVEMRDLVSLANRCERAPCRRNHDLHP